MFNYRYEKMLFDAKWKKIRREYTRHGMTPEDIQKLYLYDLDWFRSGRTYENRTEELPSENSSGEKDVSALFQRFSSLYETFDERNFLNRFAWVEAVKDKRLLKGLKKLSEDDLELLTLLVIYGYSQAEIALKQGCNQSVISRKFNRIKTFFQSMS